MKTLKSPFDTGEMNQDKKQNSFFYILEFLEITSEPSRYIKSLKKQMKERGKIPNQLWGDIERVKTAKKIGKILNCYSWFEGFSFHPDDPNYLVCKWEISNLNEIEYLMEIEETFSIEFTLSEIKKLMNKKTCFGQFVDLVIKKKKKSIK